MTKQKTVTLMLFLLVILLLTPFSHALELLDLDDGQSRFLFTGKELDDNTGMYYYGARYYDPFFKHFTQPDQNIPDLYNPQDLNRYSYVRNNPYKYVDPSGEFAIQTGVNYKFGLLGVLQYSSGVGLVVIISKTGKFEFGVYGEHGPDAVINLLSGSVSLSGKITPSAQTLSDVEGTTFDVSIAGGELGTVEITTSFDPSVKDKPTSVGVDIGGGGRAPLPVEGSVSLTSTTTTNIKELFSNLFKQFGSNKQVQSNPTNQNNVNTPSVQVSQSSQTSTQNINQKTISSRQSSIKKQTGFSKLSSRRKNRGRG